jgi:UDP-N-acetylmuramyl tripeptide synthase
MSLKKTAAIAAGKWIRTLSRLSGRQGSDLPGKIALKIYPELLRELALTVESGIYMVTGTNGKTTTTNMAGAIFREAGYGYVHNRAGANMLSGITTAFIEATNWSGRRKISRALLEVDEASLPVVLRYLTPQTLLITNFFRDQLDRYGELDRLLDLLKNAITGRGIELILNGDDPLMRAFDAVDAEHKFFGFAESPYDRAQSSGNREGRYCLFCGQELSYERFHYAQLGDYRCAGCGNHNPPIDFRAEQLELTGGITFSLGNTRYTSPYQGFFNAYNMLAAVALAREAGVPEALIRSALEAFPPQNGRMEEFIIQGRPATLALIKNPTGLEQVVSALREDPRSKNLLLILNDRAADGKDVSWIWDAELEAYNLPEDAHILRVATAGTRGGDMALRLKYAGFSPDKITAGEDIAAGVENVLAGDGERTYVLSTYTALFEVRKVLQRKGA